jgi:hypothetical protein
MRKALVGLLLASVVMTGCGSAQQTSRDTAAHPGENPPPLTDAEQWRISDAQQRLIASCMDRQGFRYWEAERLSLDESRTLGYVLDDVGWARRHGYGSRIEAKDEAARQSNPNVAYRARLPEQRRKAYDEALDDGLDAPLVTVEVPGGGTFRKRVGGCVAEAERNLYGDPQAWFRAEKVVGRLRPLYVPKVLADQRFVAALDVWAQCMKGAGYSYRDPSEARRAAVEQAHQTPGDVAFAAERRLAVVDATCAQDARLRSIGEERESHYLATLRDRYGEDLDRYASLQHEALARAKKIVGPRT